MTPWRWKKALVCAGVALSLADPVHAVTVLVDFGNDSSFRGVSVVNPDENGNYWNSVHSSVYYSDMVNAANQVTKVDLGFSAVGGTDSYNGPAGITSNPPTQGEIDNTAINAAALGDLGAKRAAFDFYVDSRFVINGLEPGFTYKLTFFGSRKFDSTDSTTTYSLCTDNTFATVVSSANLNVNNPANTSQHNQDTVAVIDNVTPQSGGTLYVKFAGASGNNGYLNAMKIEWNKATPVMSVSAGQSVVVGTASVNLSGSVSAAGPIYPANGEVVTVTINGVPHNATISGGAGGFALTVPVSSLPVGSYTISYAYGGNGTLLNGVTDTSTTLTVTPEYQTVLVDFGNSSSYRGVSVVNPDENGNYWNSVHSGAYYADMVNAVNQVTLVDLGFSTVGGTDSFNGPAGSTSNPPTQGEIDSTAINAAALGDLGAKRAAFDFYVDSRFVINGLEPGLTYKLTFFGSRKYESTDSTTTYSLCTDNTFATVVSSANLNINNPADVSQHNQSAVAVIDNVTPQSGGTLYVKFAGASGNNGYLNAMKIQWVKATPSISGVTASQSVPYGTAAVTLSGTVSAAGPVYPANGETVAVTINGVTQNATVSGGAGGFSVSFPVSTLAAGTHGVTYAYAGNTVLVGATNNATALTVSKLTPTLGVKASQSAVQGTSSITLTGVVSAAGGVVPANGETVAVTINGVSQNATISGGAGGFSVAFPVSGLAVGSYAISYSYGGNSSALNGVSDTSTTLTIKPDYQIVLVDFGNSSSYRGVSVSAPDENGRYWNSVHASLFHADMVNAINQATRVDLGFDAGTTDSYNGPAGVVNNNPPTAGEIANTTFNATALEELGATNAVFDFYVNASFQLQGLEPNLVYRLTFFGSHKFSTDSATTYGLYTDNTYATPVASVNLNVQNPSSTSQHNQDTVALLDNVSPRPDGNLYVKFRGANGNSGYLNAMKIEWLKATPTISGVPASQSVPYGTAAVTLSGTVSAPGPVYPAAGETVSVTINGVTQNATISGGAGAFSLSYPVTSLAVGSYPITYAYGGSSVLKGATNNATALTINPAIYSIAVDFGRHDGSNGNATLGQDAFGRYWNNISSQAGGNSVANGTAITTMVTTGNDPTPVGLQVISGGWAANGRLNGGLLSPSSALLGNFAVATATEDYFFISTQGVTETLRISGLNPDRTYDLRLFGTRDSTQTRITTFSADGKSVQLTTSGNNIGSNGVYDGNDDEIALLNDVSPDGSGNLDLSVTATTALGYLGILEINDALGFCLNGTPVSITPVANQTVYATGSANLAFEVTASDGEGCTAPSITAYGLPSGASFNVSDSGHVATGSFSWTPTVGQVGTYPVRFVAEDSNEAGSSDITVIIYAGQAGEGNTGGVPNSQTNWSVTIADVQVSGGQATVTWDSTSGLSYDLYSSSQPIGAGAAWTKVVDGQVAAGAQDEATVASGSMRFYQVVPEGQSAGNNGVWGVVAPSVTSGFQLMGPPLVGDRRFDLTMGQALAAAMPEGTQIHLISPGANPGWQTLELVGGQWRTEPGGALYTTPLGEGEGFIVQGAAGATPAFSGAVGNDGTGQRQLAVGYNIISLSEGKALSVNSAFSSFTPVADYDERQADQVILQNANGSWRRLVRLPTGVWYDLSSRAASSITLQPGQAYYYIRRNSSATVNF